MEARTALEAIRARLVGEWDNPALLALGPLSTDSASDVLALVAMTKPECAKSAFVHIDDQAAPNPLLFNCLTDHIAPDWSRYASLLIGGTRNLSDDPGETQMVGAQSIDAAQFFTVYGRDRDGLLDALTDCETARDVLAVGAQLAVLSGLPAFIDPALAPLVTP